MNGSNDLPKTGSNCASAAVRRASVVGLALPIVNSRETASGHALDGCGFADPWLGIAATCCPGRPGWNTPAPPNSSTTTTSAPVPINQRDAIRRTRALATRLSRSNRGGGGSATAACRSSDNPMTSPLNEIGYVDQGCAQRLQRSGGLALHRARAAL